MQILLGKKMALLYICSGLKLKCKKDKKKFELTLKDYIFAVALRK